MLARCISSRCIAPSARGLSIRGSRSLSTPYLSSGQPSSSQGSVQPWKPSGSEQLERVMKQSLIFELEQYTREAAAQAVPWFLRNMPSSYFRQIDEQTRTQHLRAIAAFQLSGSESQPELMTKSEDQAGNTVVTFLRAPHQGTSQAAQLSEMLAQVPQEIRVNRVMIYNSLDKKLALHVFQSGDQQPFTGSTPEEKQALDQITEYIENLQHGQYSGDPLHVAAAEWMEEAQYCKMRGLEPLDEFLRRCSVQYVTSISPRRFAKLRELYERVLNTEDVAIDVEEGWQDQPSDWVEDAGMVLEGNCQMLTMVSRRTDSRAQLQRALSFLTARSLEVLRVHLDVISQEEGPGVTLLRILVASPESQIAPSEEDWSTVAQGLRQLKWLDPRTLKLVCDAPSVGVTRAEVVTALCNLMHGRLAKQDPYAFALDRVFDVVSQPQHLPHAVAVADLFLRRFHPEVQMPQDVFEAHCTRLGAKIDGSVEAQDAVQLLHALLQAVKCTLRTNVYLPDRYALSLRVASELMSPEGVQPYGVFFVHGRNFNGFHVRFRDIARGGLRMVTPGSDQQHALESRRHYDEAYGLAFAQQLKNKDIPEGGSKAVCLVSPNSDLPRDAVVRLAVKAFADSILDLTTPDLATQAELRDLWGRQELIYLGPDENIIPDDIVWIIQRAAERGYPNPSAFMSSKPDAGINHKVYGVTSEGVNVFLDEALQNAGINPRKNPFTVTITGGPGGDVAGNMLKILQRDYGANAKVLGISDHTGCVEDTDGIHMGELLRLVAEEGALDGFDRSKLGVNGSLHTVDTAEGTRLRNTMHTRLPVDVLIPCGGRPATVHKGNCTAFAQEGTQTPVTSLVVEGANLFITADARIKLFQDMGVNIVKDSSANKCGVITSSYEIMSSMLLSEAEFMQHKAVLVEEVLDRLRHLARLEARLLFREHRRSPQEPLPQLSERISRAIIRASDAVEQHIDTHGMAESEVSAIVREHMPKTLVDIAGGRVSDRVPGEYIKSIVACRLGSELVYNEGLHYTETASEDSLGALCFNYRHQKQRVQRLIEGMGTAQVEGCEEIMELLRLGGVRAAIEKGTSP